jgi:thiamine biosynthesis lipoprotein
VAISVELFNLLQTAQQYSRLSNGVFDITYASVGYLYDYRNHVHPNGQAIAAALPSVDYRQLKFDPVAHTVAFGKPGLRIDTGGIAKGYSVDRGHRPAQGAGHWQGHGQCGRRHAGDRRPVWQAVGDRHSLHPDRKDEYVLRVPLEDAAFSSLR